MRRVRASAPGKAILVGEHAAVHGHPAVVAALPVRIEVTVERIGRDTGADDREGGLVLASAGIQEAGESVPHASDQALRWSQVRELTDEARRRWSRFEQGGQPFTPVSEVVAEQPRLRLADPSVDGFVVLAVGEAVHWLASRGVMVPTRDRVRLELASDVPVGAGCGSSAPVACAVTASVLALYGVDSPASVRPSEIGEGDPSKQASHGASWSELQDLAQEVERRQHGRPSGVDVATVLHGGVALVQPGRDGVTDVRFEPLPRAENLLEDVRTVVTGRRPESTGEVVAAVAERLRCSASAARTAGQLAALGTITREVASWLGGEGAGVGKLSGALIDAERLLEGLGVVPQPVVHWLAEMRTLGVSGKISGAGSLRGPGAGLVLLLDPRQQAEGAIERAGFVDLGHGLGGAGLRVVAEGGADEPRAR